MSYHVFKEIVRMFAIYLAAISTLLCCNQTESTALSIAESKNV